MAEFIASIYHIRRAGRHVTGGVFNTADEILDCIRRQRAGVYSIYREPVLGQETAFWGDVAHFGAGKICFDPDPPQA